MAYPTLKEAGKTLTLNEKKANRDPITGEPGSHPVATSIGGILGIGAGMASAIALDAAAGAVLGPVGIITGAVLGGVLGGNIGHDIGEEIYPTQLAWWKENYISRPYVNEGADFADYEPAYRVGIEAALAHKGKNFSDLEPSIRNNWNIARGNSILKWQEAKHAALDAYERLYESAQADSLDTEDDWAEASMTKKNKESQAE